MQDAKPERAFFKRPIVLSNLQWSCTIQGECITVKALLTDYEPQRGSKRGAIQGFSRASRLRILKMVSRIDWTSIKCGLFVTLTTPDQVWPQTMRERTNARHKFFLYLEREIGRELPILWRTEWCKRKTGANKGKYLPHYHLLIPGLKFLAADRIRELWRQVLNHHGPLATDVQRLASKRHQAVYIAKYTAKMPVVPSLDYVAYLNTGGRHWGLHRPRLLPIFRERNFNDLPPDLTKQLREMASNCLPWYDQKYDAGFCLFGQFGRKLVAAVEKMCVDSGCEDR